MRLGYRILARAFHFVVPAKAGTTTGLEQAAEVRRA
jgi:hypothetical protein